MPTAVHVIGASGRSGSALVRALLARSIPVQPVVRDPRKWQALGIPPHPQLAPFRLADLTDNYQLRTALADATRIVATSHASLTNFLMEEAPAAARFVLLGSTRRYTRWLDAHGEGVLRGETAFLASGRRGVLLHPTMIYGAEGENNVRRLAQMLRRLPLVPLPGGGRSLVQPIHQDDLTACILAALEVDWQEPRTLAVAGGTALRYADFVRAVARAAGLKPPRIIALPAGLLMTLAPLVSRLPGLPAVTSDEIRRLTEDKAFDLAEMSATLGVRPMPLEAGLARTFAA